MSRQVKNAKDIVTGELVYFVSHAKATYLGDGSTVEDTVNVMKRDIKNITLSTEATTMVSVTYEELKNLRDNGELVAGQQYRITDYETTTVQANTRSAGHQFDLIVTADDEKTLNEVARACKSDFDIEKYKDAYSGTWGEKMLYLGTQEYEGKEYHLYESESHNFQMLVDFSNSFEKFPSTGDVYTFRYYPNYARSLNDSSGWGVWERGKDSNESIDFKHSEPNYFDSCKLEAWQIWYSLDNDAERFAWARTSLYSPVTNQKIIIVNDGGESYIYVRDSSFDSDGKCAWLYDYGGDNKSFIDYIKLDEESLETGDIIYTDSEELEVGAELDMMGTPVVLVDMSWTEDKGVIYRMIDEWNNDCPYDFKNIQFKRGIYTDGKGIEKSEGDGDFQVYCYTFSWEDNERSIMDATIVGNNGYLLNEDGMIDGVYSNVIKSYIKYTEELEIPRITQQFLNDIVFLSTYTYRSNRWFSGCRSNIFNNNCHNNSFGNNCDNNNFGYNCHNNSFGNGCGSNNFSRGCRFNSFDSGCRSNSFGDGFDNNSFGTDCYYNNFGDNCIDNIFGKTCFGNEFGNICRSNSFGDNCRSNSFGNACESNTFGNNCIYNSFGNGCKNNSFGTSCDSNGFGNNCTGNSIGKNSSYTSFGDGCSNNKFGSGFYYNSLGNYCRDNNSSNSCFYNNFGNSCTGISLGSYCNGNRFGDDTGSIKFGNYCEYNSFGNDCIWIELGNYCEYNSFGNGCKRTNFSASSDISATPLNYCKHNHFDDGSGYAVIFYSGTTSSDYVLQNINVNKGLSGTYSNYNAININTLNSEKEINVFNYNGHIYVDYGDIFKVTYSELVDLRDNSQLIPGRQYRITDYVTTTGQKNTTSAEHKFDIIVTAINEYTLSEDAQAIQNYDEGYFDECDLNAWELKYCLDNDIDRFTWVGREIIENKKIPTNVVYDSSSCSINSNLVNGNEFITPFLPEYYIYIDPIEGGELYDSTQDESLFYEFGYEVEPNGITENLCIYKSEEDIYQDEGVDYADKFFYRGIKEIDGEEYDYWQKCETSENDTIEFGIFDSNNDSIKDYKYMLTSRIVTGNVEINEYKPLNYIDIDYTIIVDEDSSFGDAEPDPDYSSNFKLVSYGYELDNNGQKTLVAYRTDASPEDVNNYRFMPDYDIPCFYVGTENVDGVTYDKWRVISDWDWDNEDNQKYYLTEQIVENGTIKESAFINYDDIVSDVIFGEINGKGIIYYMKDEWGNECPYDFKNIKFYNDEWGTYVYTFTWIDDSYNVMDTTVFGNNGTLTYYGEIFGVYGNVIKPYMEMIYDEDSGDFIATKQSLNNITFISDYGYEGEGNDGFCGCYNNSFGNCCHNNSFSNCCHNNIFGNSCNNNIFGNSCEVNSLGDYCYSNRFDYGCNNNSLSNGCNNNEFNSSCYNNIFGNDCHSNRFGYGCNNNSLGNGCNSNNFGNDCHENSFGNNCRNNIFGNKCYCNSFSNNFHSNLFGNDCYGNRFGNYCSDNSLSDNCKYNSFGNKCYSNSFNNKCEYNNFGDNCYNNSFGDNCGSNSFDDYCSKNSFGNNCNYNSFDNNCYSNIFGNNCYSNSFGNECKENSFGNYCYYNTFGNYCTYNTFEDSCKNNSFGNSCEHNSFGNTCTRNIFGNGGWYNEFGSNCNNNSFSNSCQSNKLSNYCDFNSFGVYCKSNKLGNNCSFNSFGNDCDNNSFKIEATIVDTNKLLDYCQYNHFDDGCHYNVIWNDVQPTSTNKLQNINVVKGISKTGSNYNFINILDKNAAYEIKVAKNSKGDIKVYCEADLIE